MKEFSSPVQDPDVHSFSVHLHLKREHPSQSFNLPLLVDSALDLLRAFVSWVLPMDVIG